MRTTDVSYGEDYFETLDGGRGYCDSTMWEDIAHIIGEVYGPVGVPAPLILDLGCAKGYLVRHLRRRGFDAWGVDISEYALKHAPEETETFLRLFDLTSRDGLFFGTNHFDLVVSFETYEHIEAQYAPQAVKHLWDALKPGGRALLTICVDGQPGWDDDPTHVNITERSFWNDLFETRGFLNDTMAYRQVMRYRLFAEHLGVFTIDKPRDA